MTFAGAFAVGGGGGVTGDEVAGSAVRSVTGPRAILRVGAGGGTGRVRGVGGGAGGAGGTGGRAATGVGGATGLGIGGSDFGFGIGRGVGAPPVGLWTGRGAGGTGGFARSRATAHASSRVRKSVSPALGTSSRTASLPPQRAHGFWMSDLLVRSLNFAPHASQITLTNGLSLIARTSQR
jgi:hypothetical protein